MLHVPRLSHHLLSMNQLCRDNKCRCIVDEFSICIQDKATGQMLYQGLSNNAVYPLSILQPPKSLHFHPATFLGQKVSIELWHCKLRHPANPVVNATLSRSKILFSCNSNPKPYTACLQGKFTKLPFPVIASKFVVPFEVIHTDV